MKLLETVKEHPYWTAGAIFGVGLVLILLVFGRSKPAATPQVVYQSSPTGDGTALQVAQVQAQAQVSIATMAAQAKNADTSALVTLGTIQAQQQGQLGAAQIAAVQDTTNKYNTLNAAVEQSRIDAAKTTALAATAASVSLGAYNADVAKLLSNNSLAATKDTNAAMLGIKGFELAQTQSTNAANMQMNNANNVTAIQQAALASSTAISATQAHLAETYAIQNASMHNGDVLAQTTMADQNFRLQVARLQFGNKAA